MAFTDTKVSGNIILSQDWNDFVDFTEATSSNAYKHSANSNIHLTSLQKTDLTDGGDTTLHIHDSRYYTETESLSTFAGSSNINRALLNSISSNLDSRVDTLEGQDEFDHTTYQTSSTAISRFADSSNIRFRFKASSGVWSFVSSQNVSGGTMYADDIHLHELVLTGTDLEAVPHTIRSWFRQLHSAGMISGGTIYSSQTTKGKFNISGGYGLIRQIDNDFAPLKFFDWSVSSSIYCSSGSVKYCGVKYNSGNPVAFAQDTDTWDLDTTFPLGTVINRSGTLCILNNPWWVGDGLTNVIERFWAIGRITRDVVTGGLILGESGDGNRRVTLTAGKLWSRLNEFDIDAINTATTGTFIGMYRDGATGWKVENGKTQWPNTYYDDGDGVLGTVTVAQYANLWFYILATGKLIMVYPQQVYSTAAQAEAGGPPSTVPNCVTQSGILVGRIIFKGTNTTASAVQSAFSTVFTPTQATDHGNLAGLSDYDHPQYYISSLGQKTSGSVHRLWTWSSNKSWYANSSNVRFRFPASSTALAKYLASSSFKRNNWDSHAWLNSGIVWDETLSAWKPKKSGATAGSTPGGADTEVQFNEGGSALGGDSEFTWITSTKTLNVQGTISGQVFSGGTYYTNADDTLITNDRQLTSKAYVDAAITAGGGYTDEDAQDAVGAMVTSEFVYDDETPALSLLGYTTISSNAAPVSSAALGKYYPSALGKALYNFSANKSLYANSANVRFRFVASSISLSRYNQYIGHSGNTFPHITTTFSSNVRGLIDFSANKSLYPASSLVNRALIDSISSNIDTRVDSLFNWSSNKGLYYLSSLGHYYTNSGTKLHSAYISTSTGVFALAEHTHDTLALWSGAYQFYAVSSLNKTQYAEYTGFSGNLHYFYNSGDKLHSSYLSANKVLDTFNHTLYIVSSVAISKFYDSEDDLTALLNDNYAGSANVNWTKITAISSGFDGRLDDLEDNDVFDHTNYIYSTTAISKFLASSAFKRNEWNSDAWHNSSISWDKDLSAWKAKKSGSTGGASNLSELTIDIDKDWNDKSIYNAVSISSNYISTNTIKNNNLYSYGEVIIGDGNDLGDYKLQVFGDSYLSGNVVFVGVISGVTDPTYASGVANKHYVDTISSNSISKYTASGKIAGLNVSIMTPVAGDVLKWDNINLYWSSQADETGGGGGGASLWAYLNAGTGITPQWDSNTYGLSGAGSDITIAVAGYSTISSNAIQGKLHSSNARFYYYPSSLGKSLYDFSANKTLYPASSLVNRALIDSISSNIDTRVDSLFNWSSNALTLYGASSHTHTEFLSWSGATGYYSVSSNYLGHSSNADIHYPSSQILGWLNALYQESGTSATSDVAWSGAYQFYSVSSLNKTQYEEYTNFSSNKSLYPASSLVNRGLIDTISSNIDTRVDSLFGWSSNANNLYADSSNVRFRFPGSSSIISRYAPSRCTRYGWNSISNEGTIAHTCSSKPTWVNLSPSGSTPIMYAFTVDDSNITVYHSNESEQCFSWRAIV